MNIMPTTGSPARGGRVASTTCYTCCKPAAPKSLIYKDYSRFSRFSRLVDDWNIRLRIRGYTGEYRGLTSPPAEPAEPAGIVLSQWVKRSRVVAATLRPAAPYHRHAAASAHSSSATPQTSSPPPTCLTAAPTAPVPYKTYCTLTPSHRRTVDFVRRRRWCNGPSIR
jgi:hypothetical protein